MSDYSKYAILVDPENCRWKCYKCGYEQKGLVVQHTCGSEPENELAAMRKIAEACTRHYEGESTDTAIYEAWVDWQDTITANLQRDRA